MASPQASVRQRPASNSKKANLAGANVKDDELDTLFAKAKQENQGSGSQWDYKLGFAVVTILAFATRFWGISHPNEVVFDEVHFGKVCSILEN
jgi:dolichyl-phosphate-mannose-protein mannosyltransferase